MYFLLGIIALIVIVTFCVDLYEHRLPLTSEEVFLLAEKRRRVLALQEFVFSRVPQAAHPAEKKAMKKLGEHVGCDTEYLGFPARIAGLLKYKKHEWIVIAFVYSKKVKHMWWNKGPDGTKVWLLLDLPTIEKMVRTYKPDAIVMLHNHPNPDPSRFRMNVPSEADHKHALFYWTNLRPYGVSLLEFICERGVPYLYYASFADSVIPVSPIIENVEENNGKGIFKNYRLRKELGRTKVENVTGPNSLASEKLDQSRRAVGLRCYPNPFFSSTKIFVTFEASGYAEISIVNLLGEEVERLFVGELDIGEHHFTWDAGKMATPRGTYSCVIRMNGGVETLPMMLLG